MKVYLSPSQQESNIGVGAYGSESYRCQDIADRVRRLLVGVGIDVKQTPRDWEPLSGTEWLAKVVAASNDWGADRHTCIHTNAASDKAIHGTDAWHYPGSVKGKALTEAIYGRVVEVSGKGRGIHTEPVFYETKYTNAPCAYLELIYHTNWTDALSVINRPDDYARAIAEGICADAGVKLTEAELELIKSAEYPLLKNAFVKYMIRAQNEGNTLSVRDCDGFGVLAEKWGVPAQKLAWRISGRLDGVKQTAKPTVQLFDALMG